MKLAFLLIMLVLSPTQAHETEPKPPYPEFADDTFPVAHWQLTLINRNEMIDLTSPGFENYSRASCIKEGIEKLTENMKSVAVKEWGAEPLLGFICEYVDS